MLLLRLIILGLFIVAAAIGWRWWRARQLLDSGGLGVIEINEMVKLAQKSKRMEAALLMRTKIVGEAEKANMRALAARVDPVIRKLARQVELREDMGKILEELDEEQLERDVRTAKAEVDSAADDSERVIAETKKQQLETQLEQLSKLKRQRKELNAAGDRIIRELQNLHLALVNASATEAKALLDSGDVKESLAQLEEASEEVRRKADAEEEVAALIRKAQRMGNRE